MLEVLRTPEDRIAGIDEYAHEPHYYHWTEPAARPCASASCTRVRVLDADRAAGRIGIRFVDEGQGPARPALRTGQQDWKVQARPTVTAAFAPMHERASTR